MNDISMRKVDEIIVPNKIEWRKKIHFDNMT